MGYGSNCGMIGDMDPDPSYGGSSDPISYSYSYSSVDDCERPMFSFYSEEELVTSEIFQKHLTMALKHKDKSIRDLQNELLKTWDD